MRQEEEDCDRGLRIMTLGDFKVTYNDHSLTDEHGSSLKLWELFKFFITYRDELILPEKIIDSIWPDADYQDPKRTLRALVFRLRKILSEYSGHDGKDVITHTHGCYKLVSNKFSYIDVVEYEEYFEEAFAISKQNPSKAIQLYYKAINIYKKGYLAESYEHEWLVPARNYYRRIFLQSVLEISELLKKEKEYQQISVICQDALKYERLEEGIHFKYIEALAAMGRVKQAQNHYEYVVDLFEREQGVKPSDALTHLYRLLFVKADKIGLDMVPISESLKEDSNPNGPVFCDPDFFRLQYQLEERRSERDKQPTFLGLLTLSMADYALPPEEKLKSAMQDLKDILILTLRKGDIVSQWNEAQFVINLPGLNIEQTNMALDRVDKRFNTLNDIEDLIMHRKVEVVLPTE